VRPPDAGVTWHDPCYLGRHNGVYTPPRELLGAVTAGAGAVEMPRHAERSFCCGAGGARMWMEERTGKRINVERVEEALATGAGTIAVGCPYCHTMLGDGVAATTGGDGGGGAGSGAPAGSGRSVEVVDVATLLLRSVRPE
jgi:Fe-S oxidoreductase